MNNFLNWWFSPTVGKGAAIIAVVFLLAWTIAGWIISEPLALKFALVTLLAGIEIILLLAVRIALKQLADYAGRLEDEREE